MKKILKKGFLTIIVLAMFLCSQGAQATTISPPRFELSGDPGSRVSGQITLINEDPEVVTLYSSFENFESQGETGAPKFTRSTEGLAGWISAPKSISIPAGESRLVGFTIDIPANAESGGNYAAIFWGTNPPGEPGSSQLTIGAKIGALVLLTVSGEIKEDASVLEFDTTDKARFYTALPVDFYYRFQNGGNDRIKPAGNLVLKNIFGSQRVNANVVDGNVLPKSVRKFEILWKAPGGVDKATSPKDMSFMQEVKYQWRNFAFGRFTTDLTLSYGSNKSVSAQSFVIWIFPWKVMLVALIAIALALFILIKGFRLYNRWVISKARAEIEREKSKNI